MKAFVLLLTLVTTSYAQLPSLPGRPKAADKASSNGTAETDPLGRSTPKGTVRGFLEAMQGHRPGDAVQYLQIGKRPGRPDSKEDEELADKLKVILDRGLSTNLNNLSSEPEGRLDDGLSPDQELVGTIHLRTGGLDILLARVNVPKQGQVWLFSAETLKSVPEVYDRFGQFRLSRLAPAPLAEVVLFEVPLWQWIAGLLVIPIALGISWLLTRLAVRILRMFVRRTPTQVDDEVVSSLPGPLLLFLTVVLSRIGLMIVGLPLLVRQFLGEVDMILGIGAITWFSMRLLDTAAQHAQQTFIRTQRQSAVSIVPLGRRIAKAIAISVACLAILDNVGFDLRAVITGLGVGGIAVALGAQKTLENLFGGFMIVADQPVRVGDFCRFGDTKGVVEDIGIRSTRIRTPDRTLVAVPNGLFAAISLENYGPRDKIWFHPKLGIRFETTADQLRYILAEIRRLLYEHPKVESETARVRFAGFGASSLDLEVFAYVLTSDYAEFTAIQEDLLLRVMDIVETSGSGLAFPSQTTYLSRDSGLDPEKSLAAAERVKEWRSQNQLPFPDFPKEHIAEIQNRLPYPPPESAVHSADKRST